MTNRPIVSEDLLAALLWDEAHAENERRTRTLEKIAEEVSRREVLAAQAGNLAIAPEPEAALSEGAV